jgi:hypothetical protein
MSDDGTVSWDAPVFDLDLRDVGDCLVRMLTTSVVLGHTNLHLTADTYAHPEPGTPAAFVKDLLLLGNEEIASKWFGGTEQLLSLHGAMMAAAEVMQSISGDAGP